MDTDSAKNLIRETFQNPFDKTRFINFSKNLLNHLQEATFVYRGNYIPDAFKQYIQSLERIGKYQDPEKGKIDVLMVQLKKETSLERARTMQRNFIGWYLNGSRGDELKDAALVAFVSPDSEDWRFSLVKMDYIITESPTGKIRAKEEFTPARRLSFLVGKNENSHTAQSRLMPLLVDDAHDPFLKDIEEAFNVEIVSKEFFAKYRELFLNLKESLDEIVKSNRKVKIDFESKNINTVDFSKKLLGQIVFLYFLQKKGWFGVKRNEKWGEGSKRFLRELFEKNHGGYKNFYNDILESLFYEALRLERPGDYYSRFDCRIPFLNGGLFDPLNDYEWIDTDILIPNEIFSNHTKTKEGDTGDGILDIFDRYNFTVKEDEPLEKEVAIDPEMLGKVFENLLEVKDRKSKGTYYTPREIVHYMCRESLTNYLSKALEDKVNKADIETLIKYGETVIEHDSRVLSKGGETDTYSFKLPKSVRDNAKLIDEKLASIRVCDPAVGSGAFPVGMMHEVIRTRNALTPHIGENGERSPYNFKRHAIQNCLYGVDIDPSAVEIAKLRLWLSLVVDEEDREIIQPLPNLDYKIVQGNSLLGVEKNLLNHDLFNKLEEVKPLYFNETSAGKKQKYKGQIADLISQITNGHKDFDFEVYFSEVFHQKGGFDVVIANPPYIGEKGHKENFHTVKNGILGKFYQRKMDIFYFFFHLALNLGKNNLSIAFISTNYYPTATGATKLRQDFKNRAIIKNLINFNELKIFESALGQHNMITVLEKGQNENSVAQTCITQRQGTATPEILQQILNGNDTETQYDEVSQKDLYDGNEVYIRLIGNSIISSNPILIILDKIKTQNRTLGSICNVNQGILTGADRVSNKHIKTFPKEGFIKGEGIFVLNNIETKLIVSKELLKPWFKNSDILKYHTKRKSEEYLIYLTRDIDLSDYKDVEEHIRKYAKIIKNRPKDRGEMQAALKLGKWWVVFATRKDIPFNSAKIVVPQRSHSNTFGYNDIPWYASADVYFITERDKSIPLKYILALLNSNLYYHWLYHRGKRKGEMLELYQKPLSEIPIKKIDKNEQKPFIDLVDKILAITKDNDYLENQSKQAQVREYEKQIDQLVYNLYDLTPEEIEIVENSTKR